jgi:hypothetical protein
MRLKWQQCIIFFKRVNGQKNGETTHNQNLSDILWINIAFKKRDWKKLFVNKMLQHEIKEKFSNL